VVRGTPRADRAIVTVAIGEDHLRFHHRFCRAPLERYAIRHGYDLHSFDRILDPAFSVYHQKLLVLEHLPFYRHVLVLDSDVLVNPQAPCLVRSMGNTTMVGAVTWSGSYARDPEALDAMRDIWSTNGKAWVRDAGLKDFKDLTGVDEWLNTGVLALQPHHCAMMREICGLPSGEKTSQDALPAIRTLAGRTFHLDKRFNRVLHWHLVQHYPFFYDGVELDEQLVRIVMKGIYRRTWFLHLIGPSDQNLAEYI
jgi:hypothetical protein